MHQSGIVRLQEYYKELAEREGFEPPIPVKVYTLSRRAPSATRPSLRTTDFIFYFSRESSLRIFPPRPMVTPALPFDIPLRETPSKSDTLLRGFGVIRPA